MKRFALFLLAACTLPARGAVDFAREVRPIFSENCFTCHGPDANKRKAGLRLDHQESAFSKMESGETPIVPGDVEKSDLLRRIVSTDKDEVMPPPKEHRQLKPEQVALLRRWIEEGAVWTGHWAFQPVKPTAVPAIADRNARAGYGDWSRNPIDAFILQKLGCVNMQPSPAEEPARLIRRLSLDLTGLPPAVAEVDDFLADRTPQAYEKAVDRLLASPHFGERLAIPWLDLARYGDTGGYHNDSLREMWLWRDWVINAFNANKPFDQFTVEQLAGDLLPNATRDQKIATGFMRNVMTSDEGGIIDDEYLNLYIVDRVSTMGVTWLGLTVGCAQCHDHKYDPLTQREFYQMYSFFHNVPEKGKDGVRDHNPSPYLLVLTPEQQAEFDAKNAQVATLEKKVGELTARLDADQAEWEKQFAGDAPTPVPPGPFTAFPLDENGNGISDQGEPVIAALNGDGTFIEGTIRKSFRTEGKGHIDVGEHFGFEKNEAFSASAWLRFKGEGGAPFGKMEAAPNYRGWDLQLEGGRPVVHLIHQWPNEVILVRARDALPADKFQHVAFTYDGSGKAAGVKIFVNGRAVPAKAEKDKLAGTMMTDAPFRIGQRGGVTFNGRVDDLHIYSRALKPSEVALLAGGPDLAIAAIPVAKRTPEQKAKLRKVYRESQATDFLTAQTDLEEAKKEAAAFEKKLPNTMVMEEMATPRDTFIKVRGQYDHDGEKVAAGTPAFLPAIGAPANGERLTRLDLARWIASPQNPLTARVAVNRFWAMLFGTGLVKTVNDFGAQGEWPSHPELLEWLAADFARDWDIKRCLKQMVTSAAYQQSSKVTPQVLAKDSENRLLARGPRTRLDAEIIRDNALAVGGILNANIGGPSFRPPQPPGIWEVNEMAGVKYVRSTGEEQYRRGLYVYWRRSTVYPSFITFDAPTREFCQAQRAKTSTPLQSLVLMNDPVFVEASRAFAQRILREVGSDATARLTHAWRLALARAPSEQELAVLQKTLVEQLATFADDETAATALTKIGDLAKPDGADEIELAAWTAVASVILNLNETITN
jgi:mono/diheme cytochrome c family protein